MEDLQRQTFSPRYKRTIVRLRKACVQRTMGLWQLDPLIVREVFRPAPRTVLQRAIAV